MLSAKLLVRIVGCTTISLTSAYLYRELNKKPRQIEQVKNKKEEPKCFRSYTEEQIDDIMDDLYYEDRSLKDEIFNTLTGPCPCNKCRRL